MAMAMQYEYAILPYNNAIDFTTMYIMQIFQLKFWVL